MQSSCATRHAKKLPYPAAPEPGVVFHVAANTFSNGTGAVDSPFPTLAAARDAIRLLKEEGRFPAGGALVRVYDGEYQLTETLFMDERDSGRADAPVVYRAETGATPRFSGGVHLQDWSKVTDPAVLERLPPESRGHVLVCKLPAAGVKKLIPFSLGGFAGGRGFKTHPHMELFVDAQPMITARWPNHGFVKTTGVSGELSVKAWDGRHGTPDGRILYEGDRPARWVGEPDAWLYGYWFWDWADSYERVASIDPIRREITLEKPWHKYGYRAAQRFFGVNLLCELDQPGEWYLDFKNARAYLYPPCAMKDAVIELSCLGATMVELKNVSHVRFEGLLFELGAADGVKIAGGEQVVFAGCTMRMLAGNGLEAVGGKGHVVRSCNLHTLGRGGIIMSGGDRKTLTPCGHVVENCCIHHLSRIDHTYTPGILFEGVGARASNNLIHDVASSALRLNGNDHLVERNEVTRVVLESDDQGGVDMWGNATFRGNVLRNNYFHHLGNWDGANEELLHGQAGIRLDDAISGVLVEGNIFHKCSAGEVGFGGVQIHGGKDNLLTGNLFVDCRAAVSFSPWGKERWLKFVATAMEDPAIDAALYLKRYPELARLKDDPDVNTVRDNAVARCGRIFLRAPEVAQTSGNKEAPSYSGLIEGPDSRLLWDKREVMRLGLDLPLREAIGLQSDVFRLHAADLWLLQSDMP